MTSTIKVTSHNYPVIVDTIDSGVVTDSVTLKPEDGERTFHTTTTRELRITDLEYDGADNRPWKQTEAIGFGSALRALKAGKKVARAAWRPDLCLRLGQPTKDGHIAERFFIHRRDAAENETTPIYPWIAGVNEADLLGEDWFVIKEV